jgi:FlaA1/EpsC-like NDP-sugar epimerase
MGSFHRNVALLQERTREVDSVRDSLRWHVEALEASRAEAENARKTADRMTSRMSQLEKMQKHLYAAGARWALSKLDVEGKNRLAIYGTAELGRAVLSEARNLDIEVLAFVDSRPELRGLEIEGVPCVSPADLPGLDVSDVVIASETHYGEMKASVEAVYGEALKPAVHWIYDF